MPAGVAEVLALRYDWRGTSLVTVHNFAGEPRTARLRVGVPGGELLADVCAARESRAGASGEHEIELEPYGRRWFRVGAADNALNRAVREEPA